jgi:predicted nucleic acid-binding protein
MARFAVSDASPVIGLALVGGLQWLPVIFGKVWVTQSVHQEVLPIHDAKGKKEITKAFNEGWLHLYTEPIAKPMNSGVLKELDIGEKDCISLGLMQPKNSTVLLIDERLGRAVALEVGLRIIGTAGIIGAAKKQGLIQSARPFFAKLHASDFRISAEVIKAVLVAVGEDSYK